MYFFQIGRFIARRVLRVIMRKFKFNSLLWLVIGLYMTIAFAYHTSISPQVESVAEMSCVRLYEMINRFYNPFSDRL